MLKSDFLLICVTEFEPVKKVCFETDGIIAANHKDLVVADSSTISPEQSKYNAEALRRTIFYIGDVDGSANALKLALNLNIALIASALSEGITFVKACGIDPGIFIKILNSTYFKTGQRNYRSRW